MKWQAMTAVLLIPLLSACTMAQSYRWKAQSHFSYPNSNIAELGPVKAKANGGLRFVFGNPDIQTSKMDQAVYKAALSQYPGADMIVDYVVVNWVKAFFPFSWSGTELDGTAATMEVIEKRLE